MALLQQYTSKEFNENSELGRIKTVIIAGNGIFEKRSSWIGEGLGKVSDYGVPTYPEMKTEIKIKNNTQLPKIPKEAILYVIKWYRDTTNATGDEAQVNFYHDFQQDYLTLEDGSTVKIKDIPGVHYWSEHLFSYTPIQSNSKTLTSVSKTDPYYDLLNKQIGMYIETHSHNSMSAFASGTDLANSGNDAIQLVFGLLDTDNIQMHSWVTVREFVREGIYHDELESYVEMPDYKTKVEVNKNKNTPENYYKYYIPVDELDLVEYDRNLLNVWNNQVTVPTPAVEFPKAGLGNDYNDWIAAYDSGYQFGRKTRNVKHKAYTYVPFGEKLNEVESIVIDYFDNMLSDGLIDSEAMSIVEFSLRAWRLGAELSTYNVQDSETIAWDLINLILGEAE